jgi:hypothetical protein
MKPSGRGCIHMGDTKPLYSLAALHLGCFTMSLFGVVCFVSCRGGLVGIFVQELHS